MPTTLTMRERAECNVARIAGITDKVLPHLESMEAGEILNSARNLERFDYVARRNYGLENQPTAGGLINIAILTNQAAVNWNDAPNEMPNELPNDCAK